MKCRCPPHWWHNTCDTSFSNMRNYSDGNASADEVNSPADFEFLHHLFDTIILLGGRRDIAGLLKKSLDLGVTNADVDLLRNYNIELLTEAKHRLASINKLRIQTNREPKA